MSEAEVIGRIIETLASKTQEGEIFWDRSRNNDEKFSYEDQDSKTYFSLRKTYKRKIEFSLFRPEDHYFTSTEGHQNVLQSLYQFLERVYAERYEKQLNSVLKSLEDKDPRND